MDQPVTSWGSLLRRDHFCGRTSLPINDLSPCTCPCHIRGGVRNPPCVNAKGKPFFLCVVLFSTRQQMLFHLTYSHLYFCNLKNFMSNYQYVPV